MASPIFNQEGRLSLALNTLEEGKISTVRAAAVAFGVPRTTLFRRLKGVLPKRGMPATTRKLTRQEEDILVRWVLDIDSRGYAPRVSDVARKANLLLSERVRGTSTPPPIVGVNWATKLIRRRDDLSSEYFRKKDYQRALCEDPKIITDWFRLVQNMKLKYGIVDADMWNFDETGFQMGVISTARVVTGTERQRCPVVNQPGNRDWVTVIESVAADGRSIDPLIIFAGKLHQEQWFRELMDVNCASWKLAMSETGWTNDEIGLWWLRDVFDAQTKGSVHGKYRLLILDGHSSHNTPEFDDYCRNNNIITLYMPPHASHLLQPLDVACFSPLKRAYGQRVEDLMRLNHHHIDKSDFLTLYVPARAQVMRESTIKAGFRASGLNPLDPSVVLDQLSPQVRTPSPSPLPSSQDPENGWVPRTPRTVEQINHSARTLAKSLKRKTVRTPSPTLIASLQMAKAAQHAVYAYKLSEARVAELEQEVKRLTKKRNTKRKYRRAGGLISANDVELSQVDGVEEVEEDTIVVHDRGTRRHCGRCGEPGHNSRTCTSS